MDRRLKLHEHLVALCPNVYFQPGANVTLKYPCIIYSRYDDSTLRANNKLYHREVGYQLTVIYREADNGLADEIIIEEYEGQKINDIQKYKVDIFAIGSDWIGKFDYLKPSNIEETIIINKEVRDYVNK